MFERYTERARRVIFFARYEASTFGSHWIETEHLLLGALREDKTFAAQLGFTKIEAIRKQLEEQVPHPIERTATSVDLPLSHASKRALAYGAEEAERLHHKFIDSGHLVLGMLREEKCTAAALLAQHGIALEGFRVFVGSQTPTAAPELRSGRLTFTPVLAAAPSLGTVVGSLQQLVENTVEQVEACSYEYGERKLKRKPWSRKEALGHLIDWAAAHQQWFARALTEPTMVATAYPADEWVAAQQYRSVPWRNVVELWASLSRHVIRVLGQISEDKLNTPCRIGVAEPIPLSQLITRYVEHCEDIVGQILARL